VLNPRPMPSGESPEMKERTFSLWAFTKAVHPIMGVQHHSHHRCDGGLPTSP
jgi:hypothetical protein